MQGTTTSSGLNEFELKKLTNWVNILSQCSPHSTVDQNSSFIKVNSLTKEVHIRLCIKGGVPNQTNLAVIPSNYRPSSSWQNVADSQYYGCYINVIPSNGSAGGQYILINNAGGIRSSHTVNASSGYPTYFECTYCYP